MSTDRDWPYEFDSIRWKKTVKNIRDRFPAESAERGFMEAYFAPELGLAEKGLRLSGELVRELDISPYELDVIRMQVQEMNRAEYNRLSNLQEEQHG